MSLDISEKIDFVISDLNDLMNDSRVKDVEKHYINKALKEIIQVKSYLESKKNHKKSV